VITVKCGSCEENTPTSAILCSRRRVRPLSAVRFRSKYSAGCLSPRAFGSLLWCHMQLRLLVPVFLQRLLLLVFCLALTSCQSHRANSGPSIEFTHIPPATQVGQERVDTISGRVRNARLKQQIVIYAHSGQWWVQSWPPCLGS
jgi:hypothetical protein